MSKLRHLKNDCIACGACASIAPDFWKLDADGYASIIDYDGQDGDYFYKEISSEDVPDNQDAADLCPVNIIFVDEE